MELDQKKEHALRCIKLGMSLEDSLFVSECTDKEIDILTEDEEFLHDVKMQQKLEEMELLRTHNIALQIASRKGKSRPIEWKLGIMNGDRYGAKSTVNVDSAKAHLPVMLVGKE